MCGTGIVGLHLKTGELHPRLRALLVPMLVSKSSRGPDSAGVATVRRRPERRGIACTGDNATEVDARFPGEPVTDDAVALGAEDVAHRASPTSRRPSTERSTNCSLTTPCARRWDECPAATSSTTTPTSSTPSSTPPTPPCPNGRSTATSRSGEPGTPRHRAGNYQRKGGASCYSLQLSSSD